MNGVRKKDQKTILDASFEESRKLVDESYVEEALKVSSNKQDRNRFWGELVMILLGTVTLIAYKWASHGSGVNELLDKKLIWSQSVFNFWIVCNLILILISIFILYALISKIKIRKTKFLRDYDFNQKAIIGTGVSLSFASISVLPLTASFLHSAIFEPLYVIFDVV